ncbi:MAG: hypothetical protein KatS3mg094_317 [Candidatus Parcubacteria bacterium]|nr:MAG: hypothetical protein KatS3mg094_317 [Candidatus Parcubacteria bacterium]
MLAKKFRFKNFNFKNFFKSDKIKADNFLVYRLNYNSQKKFAVWPSKKIFKKAVERNKIKRQIYEIIKNKINKIEDGYYLIIPLKKIKFDILKRELLKIFIKQ